jgi:HNH endonuclease
MTADEERFWRFVEKSAGCWLWTGGTDRWGYGRFHIGKRTVAAHRFAYETTTGAIPDGRQLDHLCRTRLCVRPEHLEAVTCRENLLRGRTIQAANAAKTHCARGHRFDERNTKVTKLGQRRCRECNREWERERRAELKRQNAVR